jgi:ankyrin repeat protein
LLASFRSSTITGNTNNSIQFIFTPTTSNLPHGSKLKVEMTDNDEGYSPLTLAVKAGNVDAVTALVVEQGADVNQADRNGFTPIQIAVQENSVTMIRVLVKLEVDVNTLDTEGGTPMHAAAERGDVAVIRALSELGANVNARDRTGATPMYIATQNGRVAAITALHELGADINAPTNTGFTPIFSAAWRGRVDVIRTLVGLGIDVNAPLAHVNIPHEHCGATPVHMAANKGHTEAVQALAELGADVNILTDGGRSPLFYAAIQGHGKAVRVLVQHRADVDVSSPLVAAVNAGCTDISTFLVNIGADVKQCLHDSMPPRAAHIHEMMTLFSDGVNRMRSDDDYSYEVKLSLFSLTKLMTSVGDDGAHTLVDTHIATSLLSLVSNVVIDRMHRTPYVLKRRLAYIAWRVYESTLLLDGDRLTVAAKTRRYVELACFLFDSSMLIDVLALRMTCKSNSERRRFPVHGEDDARYEELEANIIEECVGYGSCRFVSTAVIHAVTTIHGSYQTSGGFAIFISKCSIS